MRGGTSPPSSPEGSGAGYPLPSSRTLVFPLPGGREVVVAAWVPPASRPTFSAERGPTAASSAERRRQYARRRSLRDAVPRPGTVDLPLGPRSAGASRPPRRAVPAPSPPDPASVPVPESCPPE